MSNNWMHHVKFMNESYYTHVMIERKKCRTWPISLKGGIYLYFMKSFFLLLLCCLRCLSFCRWWKTEKHSCRSSVISMRSCPPQYPRSSTPLKPIPLPNLNCFQQSESKFEHIELPAKLLDYFVRSNNSNINQSYLAPRPHICQMCHLCVWSKVWHLWNFWVRCAGIGCQSWACKILAE